MKHTIISWDCSFRNFFHLIDAMLIQEYSKDKFELIYVEQRNKETANLYNHKIGLKSLEDRYNETMDLMNIKVIYLNDDTDTPYHLGKCINKGIEEAKGNIISVMDGDLLLPTYFLEELDNAHKTRGVYNLYRKMATKPVGVDVTNWTEGIIDFEKCLEVCSNKNKQIPIRVSNKGPMISARKEHWLSVGGYDNHIIWSTGLSRLGQDVTTRLEIMLGKESVALQNVFAVHPYHPTGFRRATYKSTKLLSLQQKLIDWAKENKVYKWQKRKKYTKKIYLQNKLFIDKMIFSQNRLSSGDKRNKKYNFLYKFIEIIDVAITLVLRKINYFNWN